MRRVARVSAAIQGTAVTPRLVVNRSNRYVYAQLIDDTKGRTSRRFPVSAKMR